MRFRRWHGPLWLLALLLLGGCRQRDRSEPPAPDTSAAQREDGTNTTPDVTPDTTSAADTPSDPNGRSDGAGHGSRDVAPDTSGDAKGDVSDTVADGATRDTDGGPSPESTVILAGGGPEGDIGNKEAWSARLYRHLLDGGDVTGDGRTEVVVLSARDETDFLPRYFEWLGADAAQNLRVDTAADADDAATLDPVFADADAVFIKGGDQGRYHDAWDGRHLESLLRTVVDRGGGIGGTSAGAMALADYCFAGGKDLTTPDVLRDARTDRLDDTDGGSGIHADFLSVVSGVVIDTHFTQRGRLGRLAGLMAKLIDRKGVPDLVGIGIDQQTGLVLSEGQARVVGRGSVTFLGTAGASNLARSAGEPLVWTDLRLDRLTDGWIYELAGASVAVDRAPPGASTVTPRSVQPGAPGRELVVHGDAIADELRFEWVVSQHPDPFAVTRSDASTTIAATTGFVDAHYRDWRADTHARLFRALYEHVGVTGLLVDYGAAIRRPAAAPARLAFRANETVDTPEASTLVIDTSHVTHRSLSPDNSPYAPEGGTLHAAGLIGARLHLLADTPTHGLVYDLDTRRVR